MKTRKKILLTALSATLVTSLTAGLALTAFADTATKDHEYDAKNDFMFEDFDRGNIADTVKTEGTGVDTGEKPYLHVEYTAGTSTSATDPIFKQGSGSFANVESGGTISLVMRAPEEDVELSEIMFGVRGVDNDAAVLAKPLDELLDSDGDVLPELTSEWQTFEISFATSYEDTDLYPTSTTAVSATPLLGLHIFAATATDTGTLDIASVSYATTGNVVVNDFTGGDDVQATGKAADAGTWWAGSSEGYIVKRAVNMTGGSFTVVKESAVGNYSYAVIEATGDIANLKIATTTDGTTFGTATAFDGYSVNLNGNEKGFKFTYDGESSVTVKRIYLTNVVVTPAALAIPVIDASTIEVLEDFSVAQSGFTDVWEDMSTAPELTEAGLDYRISYSNGSKVEVKDGNLVFDTTGLGDGYINFKFKSKSVATGKYIVLKVKGEDEATLDGLRFALGNPDDSYGEVVWTNQMKAGHDLPAALLGDDNPYKDGDWRYVVVDLEESGFPVYSNGYSCMDIYYSGTGKLLIDCVFFCDGVDVKLPNVEKDLAFNDAKLDVEAVTDYAYAYMYINNEGYGTTLEFDVTAKEDNFDISNLRLEFEGVGTFWASENAQGTLKTTDGKMLNELTFTKDQATHVVIDLAESGIEGAFMNVHVHRHGIGGFKLENVKLHTSTPAHLSKDLDEENKHIVKEDDGTANKVINIAANNGDYQYAGYVGSLNGLNGKFSMDITLGEGTDLSSLRLEFTSGKTLWASENDQGSLFTEDGTLLSEVEFEAGVKKTVVIDLAKSGATLSDFHIHISGLTEGSVKIENITVTPYVDYITPVYAPAYAEQLAKIPAALDKTAPVVTISTATTAQAGDEITVSYTATDDMTATADLTVTVAVTKDGLEVALTGNKFTAEEGVYTVKVTARDANGNEGEATIQITVSAKPLPPEPEKKSGCNSTVSGAAITATCALAGVIALVAVCKAVRKKED